MFVSVHAHLDENHGEDASGEFLRRVRPSASAAPVPAPGRHYSQFEAQSKRTDPETGILVIRQVSCRQGRVATPVVPKSRSPRVPGKREEGRELDER